MSPRVNFNSVPPLPVDRPAFKALDEAAPPPPRPADRTDDPHLYRARLINNSRQPSAQWGNDRTRFGDAHCMAAVERVGCFRHRLLDHRC